MTIQINIVNAYYNSSPKKIYENERGEVWNSKDPIPEMHNISMGKDSIKNPSAKDSLLVLEPCCVAPLEYDATFAKQFKYVFTWVPQAYSELENIVGINCPSRHDPFNAETMYLNSVPWNKRENEVVFIFNNKFSSHYSQTYSLRTKLAEVLHQSNRIKVSWYGRTRINKPYFKGSVMSKEYVLQRSKFVVCMENSYDPIYSRNYFTEKMPEVIESGAVPLYMGCYNIDDFNFSKDSYIDLRQYVTKSDGGYDVSLEPLLKELSTFNKQQHENYKQAMIDNVKNKNLFSIISYNKTYDTMINTYGDSQ